MSAQSHRTLSRGMRINTDRRRGLRGTKDEEVSKLGLTAARTFRYSDPGFFSALGLSNSASDLLEGNGSYGQRARGGADNDGSDTSCTLQAESSPETQFREPYHSRNDNPSHPRFERNGIVFGDHAGSGPSSGSDSPVRHSVPPDYYHAHPPHAMQMAHPYPFVPAYPAYSAYPHPLYAPSEDPGMMPPGYAPENAYYMPHYYPNPMYGVPYQPYPVPGDYTPYGGSGDSPVNYENEVWSRDHSTELCTPDTVHSDKGNSCPENGEHVASADNVGRKEASQAEEGADRDSGIAPTVQGSSPMPQNDPLYEPGTTTNGTTVLDNAPAMPRNATLGDGDGDDRDDLEPTSTYLLRAFKSGEFADYQLLLESPVARFYAMSFLAHGLIIARSPCLYSRMQYIERVGEQKLLTITTGNSFVQPKAFEIAVQNLYGLPLVSESQLACQIFLTLGYETGGVGRDCGGKVASCYNARMDFALCYAASGAFMANNSIVRRGIQLAVSSINWETVETALRFGLAANSFILACAGGVQQPETFNHDSSESDSVDSHASERGGGAARGGDSSRAASYFVANTLNQGLVEASAPEVLRKALEFVAENFPSEFELHQDAQPTVIPGRVPDISGHASSSCISSIVKFGEFAGPGDKPADSLSRETTVASAIMLSLPFKDLRKLFKFTRTRGYLSQKLVQDVVAERERRRVRALRVFNSRGGGGGNSGDGSDGDGPLPDPLGWAESVGMPSDGRSCGKASITRSWQGSYTSPLTFGPEKSRGF